MPTYCANTKVVALLLALSLGWSGCAPTVLPQNITSGETSHEVTAIPSLTLVRYGGQMQASDVGLFLATDRGYFTEQGIKIDYVQMPSVTDIVAQMLARQLDIGGAAVNAVLINAVARGANIKAVADKGSILPGFGWQAFIVRKDLVTSGRVRNIDDLRGLIYATIPPLYGAQSYPMLRRLLTSAGLTEADLADVKALDFPSINAALAGGSIDFASQLEPMVQAAVKQDIAVRWKGFDEITPDHPVSTLIYGPSIIEDNRELGRRLMIGYLKGVRDYYRAVTTGEGRDSVYEVIATYSIVKDMEAIRQSVPVGLHPNGRINIEGLIEDQRYYVEKGTVPQPIDMYQLVDMGYVEAAVQQLGAY
ncbi:MAG TPA: ABC transporter substrate-binding protein [Chloroflexota bacterium]|nr:ABC transporter substrate-binding protein [Chloroflexota bacterium]